jgi:hypothetical protein
MNTFITLSYNNFLYYIDLTLWIFTHFPITLVTTNLQRQLFFNRENNGIDSTDDY